MTDPFGPTASQVDMLAMLLDTFPGQNGSVQFSIPAKSRRPWAEQLIKRGVEVNLERMQEFPTPGDQPGMGPLNPVKWVPRAEWEARQANRPAPEEQKAAFQAALQAMDPNLAARINAVMADPAKRDALAREQLSKLPGLSAQIDRMTAPIEDEGTV